MAHEVADAREREVALEARRKLKDLAQVEQRARAAVSLRAELGPAEVSGFFEEPVENVGHRPRISQLTESIGQLNQAHGLRRHLRIHLGKALAPRLLEAIPQTHAAAAEAPRCEPVHT